MSILRTAELCESVERFINSPVAGAWLFLPNCLIVGVNRSHKKRFGGSDDEVVTNLEDAFTRLDSTIQPQTAKCHCDETNAAEALRKEDCAIEILYEQSIQSMSLTTGIQFRRIQENGHRRYVIDEISAGLVTPERPHVLEVQLSEQAGVEVEVSVPPGSPESRAIRLLWKGESRFTHSESPADKPELETYLTFEAVLDKALSFEDIVQARAYLQRIRQAYGYEYIQQGLILDRLCTFDDVRFPMELHFLRRRLRDGCILMHCREKISSVLLSSRLFDYAVESIQVLGSGVLRSAIQSSPFLRQPVSPLDDDMALRKYLREELDFLRDQRPSELSKFDQTLDELEQHELQLLGSS